MEKKQTAVEWLYQRLETMIPRTTIYDMDKREFIKQAKQMEKEQIKDAAKSCNYIGGATNIEAEQYYNETYKQQDK
jgi:hypothetical protein